MKSLLIIDDRRIRKAAFAQAEKIIKKIDQLEHDLESFHKKDQQLFSSWFDLTFRDERQRISDRHEELRTLSRFHNWMIAIAKQLDTSLSSALMLLRQEEAEYAKGSETTRAEIDEKRRQLDQYIRKEIEKEYGFDPDAGFDDEDREDEFPEDEPPLSPRDAAELQAIRQMSDKKIRKICLQHEGAFGILGTILALARSLDDQALIVRIWDLVPHKHQVSFAKDFAKQTGIPLNQLIAELKDHLSQKESVESEDHEPGRFGDEFIGVGSSRAHKKTSPIEEEATKLLYRKLVRHLHPDLQTDQDGQRHWQKQIWHRVQAAYGRNDRQALEKLYRLVLIRAQSLNELSVGEIIESQSWLKEELESLAFEAKGLKRLPSWGFSKKKDYASLKRKLKKPLQVELEEIDEQLTDLQAQHAYLELIGLSESHGIRKQRKRRTHKKKPRTKRSPRREPSRSQSSFFD